MHKILLFLLPLLFLACSSDSSSSNTVNSRTTDYPYSTDYDTSLEATKPNPMLVIRLDYPNQYFVNDESSWANKIFGTQTHQLNHYMNEVSNGQFQYSPVAEGGDENNGVVTVYFTTEHPDPNVAYPDQYHPDLTAAITAVSNYGFNFSLYDDNNNGKLTPDELLIVFIMAGGEDAYSGELSENGIWAHQWCTDFPYTPTVDGVSIMGCDDNGNYAIFGERHYDTDRFRNITSAHDASIGIIAHELGHSAFSLPDLYYDSATRIGYYGLMSLGSWGQNGLNGVPGDTPTHLCAWSKIDSGLYTNPTIVQNTTTDMTMHATGSSNYNISKVPLNNSNDEYFLIENRGVNSYDAGLKYVNENFTGGVAIWHINEQVIRDNRANNIINVDADNKGVDLEEAAGPSVDIGIGDPVQNLYYNGNVYAFTPTTVPNTDMYDDTSSGISITNISTISDSMTLQIYNPN